MINFLENRGLKESLYKVEENVQSCSSFDRDRSVACSTLKKLKQNHFQKYFILISNRRFVFFIVT